VGDGFNPNCSLKITEKYYLIIKLAKFDFVDIEK
jgi:hypothetical protein